MNVNPFDRLDRLFVLKVPVETSGIIPYMGTDGRLELFTDLKLAESVSARLEEDMHIRTAVQPLEDRDAGLDFMHACMHNGMLVFRLNNGSKQVKEYRLDDLFSFRKTNLIDEKNRTVRYYLIRSKEYAYYRALLPEAERSAGQGLSLAEMQLTMLYNAYRETYRGILYALISRAADDGYLDYYTVAAVDRAKAWLKEEQASEAGYTAVSLIHTPHQGGTLYTGPLALYYVNRPGQAGNAGNGMVCAFTSYAAATHGKALFESYEKPCTVVALTTQELLDQAMQCAGVLIDMGEAEYQVMKQDFGLWKSYGELDAPIIVNLRAPEKSEGKEAVAAAPAAATDAKEEGSGQ